MLAWDLILAILCGYGPCSIVEETQKFFSLTCVNELIDHFGSLLCSERICNISLSVYLREWEDVRNLNVITQDVDPSDVSSFDFPSIYASMQQSGPSLVDLFDHLSNMATNSHTAE